MSRTNSHLDNAGFLKRVRYLFQLFHNNRRLLKTDPQALQDEARRRCHELLALIARARTAVGQKNPDTIAGVRVLEIGCGQRCLTGLTLHSLAANYTGIDLDVVSFHITPSSAWRMLRQNGPFRLVKALVRHVFFDRPLFTALDAALREHRRRLNRRGVDVRTVSAETIAQWNENFAVIYSYDVFEHLPPPVLRATITAMMQRLTPDGCCIIRLNPFPCLMGGHSGACCSAGLAATGPRRLPPWEHLRDPESATGDTYLNQLSHKDYLALFGSQAEVVAHYPDNDLGRRFLTPGIRAEFPQFSEAELCTTGWTYIMRRLSVGSPARPA